MKKNKKTKPTNLLKMYDKSESYIVHINKLNKEGEEYLPLQCDTKGRLISSQKSNRVLSKWQNFIFYLLLIVNIKVFTGL